MWDDPDSLPDFTNTGACYLVTLTNGPLAGSTIEVWSDQTVAMVPYGDSFEMYRQDMAGDWWHAGRSAA